MSKQFTMQRAGYVSSPAPNPELISLEILKPPGSRTGGHRSRQTQTGEVVS
jgi:hypothetical protein